MSFATEITRDMARGQERNIGLTGTYVGQDFVYTRGNILAGQQLEVGGKVITIAFTVIARASAFSAAPTARSVVTLDGTKYRIANVRQSPSLTHYEMDVYDVGQP